MKTLFPIFNLRKVEVIKSKTKFNLILKGTYIYGTSSYLKKNNLFRNLHKLGSLRAYFTKYCYM